ncbi:MAG TPA: class I SAM-dependent methyltransferase [Variovorax sp.]|nr:class I SAM-dependent methyltransferase [Variovorax sp.]
MSFSTDWLALREAFDRTAREDAGLDLAELTARPLHVLDLGCGTGANLRFLAPRLGGHQVWHLVDHDARLLAALPRTMAAWAEKQRLALHEFGAESLRLEGQGWSAELHWQCADLASELDALPFQGAHLVTASALLDLVSLPWLEALIAKLRDANAALLCALNVDGRLDWKPLVAGDVQVQQLFAAHQQRDKGFGPALGADAVRLAVERLDAQGYRCVQAPGDWQIAPSCGAMLETMIDGLANAAMEQDSGARDPVLTWRLRRLALAAQTSLRVGHLDLLALPGSAGAAR